jgi:single-strand DNA-binding protein
MVNQASFSVCGYVATTPSRVPNKSGEQMLSMRIGWTPRRFDRVSEKWNDEPSSFATVVCFRKLAENAATCLRKGDPVVVKGTLRIREYEDRAGVRRTTVDIVADSIGHDIGHGVSSFIKSRPQTNLTADEQEAIEAAGDRLQPTGDEPDSALAGPDGPDGPEEADEEVGVLSGDLEAMDVAGEHLLAPA